MFTAAGLVSFQAFSVDRDRKFLMSSFWCWETFLHGSRVSAHLAKPLLFQNLLNGVCRVYSFGDNISLHRKGQTCSLPWKRELVCPSSAMDRHVHCPFKKTCNPSAQGSSPAMKPTERALLKWFPHPLYFMLNANIWIYMRWKGEGCDFID